MKTIRNAWNRWLLRRKPSPWGHATATPSRQTDRLILAILAMAAAWVACDYVVAGPGRIFNPYGGTYLAGYVLIVLLTCYLAARIFNRSPNFPNFTAAFLAGETIILAVTAAVIGQMRPPDVELGPSFFETAYYATLAALAIVAYWAAVRTMQIGRIMSFFPAALLMAGVFLYGQLQPIPVYYAIPKAYAAHKTEKISVEWTYYDQYPLMDRSLDGLAKQRPGIADLYFIGFAGYAPQDVFLKEVNYAQRLFDERFDTAGRSMLLINNRATVKETPLANGHNLWRALSALGERIDREEDVVFLFLTSHGSPDRLAVNFWPLQPDDLTPADLREMFDKAGIKWRVIVVSACYSGSFIDELRDDNTLITTAASADKTSFGCSNENEFTYFGRAFFDQALRTTFSFADGFEAAARIISERETAEGLTPSEPQIFVGPAIRAKLDGLQERLSVRFKEQVANGGPRTGTDQKRPASGAK